MQEAEITGNLEHPGVVPVYSLGAHPDGRPFYAMRFVRGESLADAIERFHDPANFQGSAEKTLELHRLLGRFVDSCNALAYAHSRGVVHRDVKPSNILLGPFNETLVVDWGLAKPVGGIDVEAADGEGALVPSGSGSSDHTRPGSALGTPQYMSPEQARGDLEHIGPRSDVYSLGATLFAILTGRAPCEAPEAVQVLAQVQRGTFPNPRSLDRSIPGSLESICLKALALEPDDRYDTAIALAEDVDRWIADEPVVAYREPWTERFSRWARRHRTYALSGAAGLAIIAAAAITATFLIEGARRSEHAERIRAEELRADLVLDRANDLLNDGHVGPALLLLAAALEELSDLPTSIPFARAYRTDLANWADTLAPLRYNLPHPDVVRAVAFHPDGTWALTGGSNLRDGLPIGEARLWNTATGRIVGDPLRLPSPLTAVAFDADGRVFATAGLDGLVRTWNTGTRRPIGRPLDASGPVNALAFSPDGTLLVAGAQRGSLGIWDISDLANPHALVWNRDDDDDDGDDDIDDDDKTTANGPPIHCLDFHDDRLAVGNDAGDVRFWDWRQGKGLEDLTLHIGSPVLGLAYRPDGEAIATGSANGVLLLWDINLGNRLLPPIDQDAAIYAVAFSPDGQLLLTGGEDNNAHLWDPQTGERIDQIMEHQGSVVAVDFATKGNTILTGSMDNTARLWDVPDLSAERSWQIGPGPIRSVAFGPKAKNALVAGGDGTIRRLGPDGTASGKLEAGPTNRAALSPDGSRIVTGGPDGVARLWEVRSGLEIASTPKGNGPVSAVAFAPNGKLVLIGGEDGSAQLWDANLAKPVGRRLVHGWGITAVAFRPDGQSVLTAGGSLVRFWNAHDGADLGSRIQHPGAIYDAVFVPPDGHLILTGGENNVARFWDTVTGRPVGLPMLHRGSVLQVDVSGDGQLVLTGSGDETARLWDAGTGAAVSPPLAHAGRVTSVAIAPDGRSTLTGDDGGVVRLRPVAPPMAGTPQQITLWVETRAGIQLETRPDPSGIIHILTPDELDARRQLLKRLGDPTISPPSRTTVPSK